MAYIQSQIILSGTRRESPFLTDLTKFGELINAPLTSSPSKSTSESQHVLTARSAVGILPLPVGEGCLDAGQVQARNNSPPLPSHFSPEVAEGHAGGLVGTLHLRVAVVEHEHLRRLRFAHGESAP